jgi:Tfp pilus assembly protein FimT
MSIIIYVAVAAVVLLLIIAGVAAWMRTASVSAMGDRAKAERELARRDARTLHIEEVSSEAEPTRRK